MVTQKQAWPLKKRIMINTASIIGYLCSFPLKSSLRTIRINFDETKRPAIYAIWHGQQYGLYSFKSKKDMNILISPSVDGQIISNFSKYYGFRTIRGSLKNKGEQALREIIKKTEQGENIAYTVDGPRGPVYKVKPGLIRMAKITGCPIIPMSIVANKRKILKTWDEFNIPGFFSKVAVVFGDPIYIDSEISKEDAEDKRLEVEETLFALDRQAKDYLGVDE